MSETTPQLPKILVLVFMANVVAFFVACAVVIALGLLQPISAAGIIIVAAPSLGIGICVECARYLSEKARLEQWKLP